jgi:hypothetical protein
MKQYIFIYLFFVLFFSLLLHAEELPLSTSDSKSIKEVPVTAEGRTREDTMLKSLIEQVKSAEVKDRRVLMNQLKIKLRAMNQESRHKAMVELKKSFVKDGGCTSTYQDKTSAQLEHKNLHEQQGKHQPQYRHLQNGESRQGGERQSGQGHGHK